MEGTDPRPGNVLLGKYRLDEVLGTGGMGKVLRAWHLYLQQPVAIKVLLPHVIDDEATVQRFLREAQATVKLRSEHIARVIDVATLQDGTPIMVMEYLDGSDLNQILRAHGPQMPQVVVDLMMQACEGIAEAHAMGIVHRDIKPSNFFVTRRIDGTQLLKILDFGISKAPVGHGELTGTQSVVGTPTYMAPEQMKHARSADMRSDIWSMGVVMYQLIEGRPPFQGESFPEVVYKVTTEPARPLTVKMPAGLSDLIMRCFEKDPTRRPQNVGELAKGIAPFASDTVGAALAADRAMRILATRGSQPAVSKRGIGGSPAPLTPNSGSVSQHGSGQVTVQTRGSRSWLIAGGLSLIIIAGAAGYIVNDVLRTKVGKENTVQMEVTPSSAAAAPSGGDGNAGAKGDSETKSTDSKATDSKTTDSKSTDSKSTDSKTTDSKATDSKTASNPTTPTTTPTTTTTTTTPTPPKPTNTTPVASKPTTTTTTTTTPTTTTPAKPTTTTPVASKPTTTPTTTTPTKPTTTTPVASKPTTTKPTTTTPAKPTTTKPTKPKNDDLFDDRH